MKNFENDLNLTEENEDNHHDNTLSTIITNKCDTQEIERLETRIKVLESKLDLEKTKNINFSEMLDQEKR